MLEGFGCLLYVTAKNGKYSVEKMQFSQHGRVRVVEVF